MNEENRYILYVTLITIVSLILIHGAIFIFQIHYDEYLNGVNSLLTIVVIILNVIFILETKIISYLKRNKEEAI